MSTSSIQTLASKDHSPQKRNKSSLQKWLIPGLRLKKYKMSLENFWPDRERAELGNHHSHPHNDKKAERTERKTKNVPPKQCVNACEFMKSYMFVTDKEVRQAYKTNIIYVLVFTLMHFPMLLLINITSGQRKGIDPNNIVCTNLAFACTIITCGTPMTIGIIRNCRGFSKIKQIQKLKRRFTKVDMEGFNPDMSKPFNDNSASTIDQFDWLEKHAMEFFMRDILLGIAHCLYNSKENYKDGQLDLKNKANEETIKHHITLKNFEFKDKENDFNELNIKLNSLN